MVSVAQSKDLAKEMRVNGVGSRTGKKWTLQDDE